jgi:hypothetical protein
LGTDLNIVAPGRDIEASFPAEGDVVIARGVAVEGVSSTGGVAEAGGVVNKRCNPIRRIAAAGAVVQGVNSSGRVVIGRGVGECLEPLAVLFKPVVLLTRARDPMAVSSLPVVLLPRAKYPVAVSSKAKVLLSKAPAPVAVLSEPTFFPRAMNPNALLKRPALVASAPTPKAVSFPSGGADAALPTTASKMTRRNPKVRTCKFCFALIC